MSLSAPVGAVMEFCAAEAPRARPKARARRDMAGILKTLPSKQLRPLDPVGLRLSSSLFSVFPMFPQGTMIWSFFRKSSGRR